MGLTSRQRRILEADMSRRQFMKLTGQAAAAAANPQAALKGLAGITPAASTPVMIAIRPMAEVGTNMAAALTGIQKAFSAAKKVGDGKVGGAAEGCGSEFEVLTAGNLDTIKQLVKSGKLKQVNKHYPAVNDVNFENFGKPISPEEKAKITKQATQDALKYINNPSSMMGHIRSDEKKLKDWVNRQVNWKVGKANAKLSEMRFQDSEGNNYWVTADNETMETKTSWFKEVINQQVSHKMDPLMDWWEMHFQYGGFENITFTKPALEFIKQKGLYRHVDDPFSMRRLVDAFDEFKVVPPTDLQQVIKTKFAKTTSYTDVWGGKYEDIKPGETRRKYGERRSEQIKAKEEQAKVKQKEDFEQAPPPSDEPESWRTQSVEFESRLHRLVR